MGIIISNLARATRTTFRIVRDMFNNFWYFDNNALENINLPSTQRPLILRNGIQTIGFTTEWGSVEIISCEQGTECKLYISVYNDRNIKVIYATVYQDTATSPNSMIDVLWTNPRTGRPGAMTFTYPVDATVIRDLLI